MLAAWRVLKDDGAFWLAIGDDFAAELKVAAQQVGFHTAKLGHLVLHLRSELQKQIHSITHSSVPLRQGCERFTFLSDDPANRIPSARQLVYNDRRANRKDDCRMIPGSFHPIWSRLLS